MCCPTHGVGPVTQLQFNQAIREALAEEMARDQSVIIIGEDIIANGGSFKVTQGLAELYPGRVLETPIAEAGIVAIGIGAALTGLRPVVEMMYMDFAMCAMDEIVNQAAKLRYMTGGQASVPLVVRLPCGPGRNLGAQHSQTMEAWFMHVPGLIVVVPSTPQDAKGLLKTAIRSPDPVMFFEYKALYGSKGLVSDDDHCIAFGQADVKREGEHISIVAIGSMVQKALEAAIVLEDFGIDAEVVDPRTLFPLDQETICGSARKTRHVIVCAEGSLVAGASAEIASTIHENCFEQLLAPVVRIGHSHVPMPFSQALVEEIVPGPHDIVAAASRLLKLKGA